MKLNIHPEACCEECGEIIHNHFDCPACGQKYSATDKYCDLSEEDPPVIIDCEKCKALYRLISGSAYWEGEWERIS